MSTQIGFGTDVDEDELMAELEELEQEDLDKEMLDLGSTTTDLPEVPAAEVPKPSKKKVEDDDDELRELESWLT